MTSWLVRRPARPLLIGVVHLAPTPGSPRWRGDLEGLLQRAERDARALCAGGCDALIVENFGDAPFHPQRVPPETVASLALALERVAQRAGGRPVGVNVLRNDARAALGLCALGLASFLRVNVHVGLAASDQGLLEGRAHETLRERQRLCPPALLLCDVHVKHATPLGRESAAEAAADTLERGLADALVVSGARTGAPASPQTLAEVRAAAPEAVVLLGSGVTRANARELCAAADGAIVGTALKRDGQVEAEVDEARVAALRAALDLR